MPSCVREPELSPGVFIERRLGSRHRRVRRALDQLLKFVHVHRAGGGGQTLSFWKMNPEPALAFSKQKTLRFWGLTGQRCWARLILDRFHDLVLSPGDSKGSTLDPDTVAHEHQSFFFSY